MSIHEPLTHHKYIAAQTTTVTLGKVLVDVALDATVVPTQAPAYIQRIRWRRLPGLAPGSLTNHIQLGLNENGLFDGADSMRPFLCSMNKV